MGQKNETEAMAKQVAKQLGELHDQVKKLLAYSEASVD